jgi:hypothetical protein
MSSRKGVKGRTRHHKLRSTETKATTHVGGANEPAVELKKNLDLWPLATLRWNNGVHNYMTYITGDIPRWRV